MMFKLSLHFSLWLPAAMILTFLNCAEKTCTEAEDSRNAKPINFFPIVQGNQWIYSVTYRESGLEKPEMTMVGEEQVRIIEHYPSSDSFTVQLTSNAIKVIKTQKGDSIIHIIDKMDTLLMEIDNSVLNVINSTIDRWSAPGIPAFHRCATYINVVLPDTGDVQNIDYHPPSSDLYVRYIMIKDVGFKLIEQRFTSVISGSVTELLLKEFIPFRENDKAVSYPISDRISWGGTKFTERRD